ncbi:MAG TPA: hypothetical protein VK152_11955 [Paludibacter sp.]|nr:hypothetical protein [Paludibacter sp.]
MKKTVPLISDRILQLVIFLSINSLFILKYVPRTGINSIIVCIVYITFILVSYFLSNKYMPLVSRTKIKISYWAITGLAIIGIGCLLYIVDPYKLRIDRWSSLSCFWDSLLQGNFPYAAHTHLRINSFTSAFPFWLLVSFPFYLLGDVGYELIFFLLITALALRYYFSSYHKAFFFLALLLVSPAYWYEISARSDSLSNGLFVFMIILWYLKSNRTLDNSFLVSIMFCGLIASTRLSAVLPIAIFFFQQYLNLPLKRKIIFPTLVLGVAFLFLSPFIFWDTNKWPFFEHNPFMAQTGNGNIYFLLIMIILGIILSLHWKSAPKIFSHISLFVFIFMLGSQFVCIYTAGGGNLFSEAISDISYTTLALPYCLAYLTTDFKFEKQTGVNEIAI